MQEMSNAEPSSRADASKCTLILKLSHLNIPITPAALDSFVHRERRRLARQLLSFERPIGCNPVDDTGGPAEQLEASWRVGSVH